MSSNNENYEHNLKLYNESIRKDLDITLTSTIPIQKNLMKTILWLNSSIIGLSIAILSKNIHIGYIVIPFVFSFQLSRNARMRRREFFRYETVGTGSVE